MGKTEIIILIIVVLFVGAFFILYLDNSKKIKSEKEKKGDTPSDKPAENTDNKKSESVKTEAPKITKKEKKEQEKQAKQLEKAQDEAKKELKSVMAEISMQSENYIKSLEQQDQQNANKAKFEIKEVSEYEVMRDEAAEEAAIILGVKQNQIHYFDDVETDGVTHETTSSILTGMDQDVVEDNSSAYSKVDVDYFEEDESVGEEFSNLSKRMKVMVMTDVFKKKSDDENQE